MAFIDAFKNKSRDLRDDLTSVVAKKAKLGRHITGSFYHSEIFFFKNDLTVGSGGQGVRGSNSGEVKVNDFIRA